MAWRLVCRATVVFVPPLPVLATGSGLFFWRMRGTLAEGTEALTHTTQLTDQQEGPWMSKLVLTRSKGENIVIHRDGVPLVEIKIVRVSSCKQVRLAIEAPADLGVDRKEVYEQRLQQA